MAGRHWETAAATIIAAEVAVRTAAGSVNRLDLQAEGLASDAEYAAHQQKIIDAV
jgi:hypothetical protein